MIFNDSKNGRNLQKIVYIVFVLLSFFCKLPLKPGEYTDLEEAFKNPKDVLVLNYRDNEENPLKTLPKEIGNLQNLKELYLSANEITTLPPEIGNLKNLQVLSLNGNRLETIPKEIGNLKNLKELSIEWNKLQTLPKEIGNLKT
ncbi:leucine rich repeat protein [Leptospira interrogans serovar Australis str. 200703203]|uniref:Leucine rich repeat protein n=1 Tax=Leptospira interrogans serovar Australis str. 200703203 TaxID=1085541 RepID=N1UEB4_LEPIR|nr:leucine rich repeat protein [Leptospira interrogans serovar Australis str. 200703203]